MLDAQLPNHEASESNSKRNFVSELMDSLSAGDQGRINIIRSDQSVSSNLQDLLPNVTYSDSDKQESDSNRPNVFNGKKPPRNIEGEAESSGYSDKESLSLPDKFDSITAEKKRPYISKEDTYRDMVEELKDKLIQKPKVNIIGEAESSDNTIKKWRQDPQELLANATYENEHPVVITGDQAVTVTPNGRVKILDPAERGESRDGDDSLRTRPHTRQYRTESGPNLERRRLMQNEAFNPSFLRPADQKPDTNKITK